MLRMIGGLLFSLLISMAALADDLAWPDVHPCTGVDIPLVTEKSVVLAIECLYQGRVAKVKKVDSTGSAWYYEIRVLTPGGRIKTLDVRPETGLPLDPTELEAVYETLDR
jgi:hypothetical protein